MGLEAYYYELKLKEKNTIRDCILNEFTKLNFKICEKNFSDVYLEKEHDNGIVEVLLFNPELQRILLNEYKENNNQKEFIDLKVDENAERIKIRIAKPNDEGVIDNLINDLKIFYKKIPCYLRDIQLKKDFYLPNYEESKESFKNQSLEFKKIFPNVSFPIRCSEVFGT